MIVGTRGAIWLTDGSLDPIENTLLRHGLVPTYLKPTRFLEYGTAIGVQTMAEKSVDSPGRIVHHHGSGQPWLVPIFRKSAEIVDEVTIC